LREENIDVHITRKTHKYKKNRDNLEMSLLNKRCAKNAPKCKEELEN